MFQVTGNFKIGRWYNVGRKIIFNLLKVFTLSVGEIVEYGQTMKFIGYPLKVLKTLGLGAKYQAVLGNLKHTYFVY